ncbi:hypothetical protein BHS07_26710 [Myxococcus xanthus]|nr:hypothetical protein BHS07_26710 [Myxococcus xanthus]QDF07552.1 hypothetical protein BHS04_30770 [Myxococcus xanthus]
MPNIRCNSRTCALSCCISDSGTTASPAFSPDTLPASFSCLQRNNWLGLTPYLRATSDTLLPGDSASESIRSFSSAE